MKKHLILATVAATAMLASCSNDNDEAVSPNVPVRFAISTDYLVTRTTTTAAGDTYSTAFENGDQVGLFSTGLVDVASSNHDFNNAVFTVSGNKLTGEVSSYYYPKSGLARFAAYYPAGECTNAASAFAVQDDQSTEENFNKSDFMTSVVLSASTTDPIHFRMKHRLAFVELKLTNMDGATVEMNNVVKGFTWNPTTDEVTTSTGSASSIEMFGQSDNQTYWALLPAQAIARGTKLFTIDYDGKNYTYCVSSDLTLAANKVTRFALLRSVTGDVVTDPSIEGDEWGETGEGESGTVTEEKNYLTMPKTDFTSSTSWNSASRSTLWTYNSKGLTSANYADGFFTVISKDACDYTKTGIEGYSSETLTVGQYTISFKIKASEEIANTTKVHIFVRGYVDINHYDYFSIVSGESSVMVKEEAVSTTVKSISLTLDTSNYRQAYRPTPGEITDWAQPAADKEWKNGIYIDIAFGGSSTNPITYQIKNLKITKN